MAIRLPVRVGGTTQTGVANTRLTFTLPQDIENLVVKVHTAATFLDAGTVDIYLQTTDDGGTTWYDCVHYAQLANTAITNANSLFGVIPVSGTIPGANTNTAYVGAAADASLAASKNSGLPILSQLFAIKLVYATAATNGGLIIDLYASQGGRR